MPSPRYAALSERVGELREQLLPVEFDPAGCYTEGTALRTKTLAFRVLAHAEIEAYLEERVIEVAQTAWRAWKSAREVSPTLLHLLAFSGLTMDEPPDTLLAPDANKGKFWSEKIDVDARLRRAVQQFVRKVSKENHGIKEHNILSMLLPIGIKHSEIDQIFLAAANSFGEKRGEAAHAGAFALLQAGVDPKSDYDEVLSLVRFLAEVDDAVTRLCQQIPGGGDEGAAEASGSDHAQLLAAAPTEVASRQDDVAA